MLRESDIIKSLLKDHGFEAHLVEVGSPKQDIDALLNASSSELKCEGVGESGHIGNLYSYCLESAIQQGILVYDEDDMIQWAAK